METSELTQNMKSRSEITYSENVQFWNVQFGNGRIRKRRRPKKNHAKTLPILNERFEGEKLN